MDTYHEVSENGDITILNPNDKSDLNVIKKALSTNDELLENLNTRAADSGTRNKMHNRVKGAVGAENNHRAQASFLDGSALVLEGSLAGGAQALTVASVIPGVGLGAIALAGVLSTASTAIGATREFIHGNVLKGTVKVGFGIVGATLPNALGKTVPEGYEAGEIAVKALSSGWTEAMGQTVLYGVENHREF